MAIDQFDTDGGDVVEQGVYGWDDIAAKLDNEGFPDGLDWFDGNEVPAEGRGLWAKAKRLAKELKAIELVVRGYQELRRDFLAECLIVSIKSFIETYGRLNVDEVDLAELLEELDIDPDQFGERED